MEIFSVFQDSLIAAQKLYHTDLWWKKTHLITEAFTELCEFEVEKNSCPAGYTALETNTRLHDNRSCGTAIIHDTCQIHRGAEFVGDVVVGPMCEIGPNCTIFGPTIVGSNSYIGPGAEIRRSLIRTKLKMSHRSYLGHSIVGTNVTLSAGFTTAVRNFKRGTVHMLDGSRLIDSGFTMFGAVIADNFRCPINYSVLPGRILEDPAI